MNKFVLFLNAFIDFFRSHVFIKVSLRYIGASVAFSFLIILILSPKFLISSTLIENTDTADTQKLDGAGGLLQALTSGGGNTFFEKYKTTLESNSVAKKMWDDGWGKRIFSPGSDNPNDEIPKPQPITKILSSMLLGYELGEYYTYIDLKQFIKNNVGLSKIGRSAKITATIQSSDKEFAIEFLDAIIYKADSEAKINEIALTESRIEYLKEGLATSKNATVTNGLSNLLNSAYFSLVTLKSDQPYFVVIVDKANSSETPISPNIYIILFANLITFLSLSAFISYFRANKEQIW